MALTMDPDACLAIIVDATADADVRWDAADDLRTWMDDGGFAPDGAPCVVSWDDCGEWFVVIVGRTEVVIRSEVDPQVAHALAESEAAFLSTIVARCAR